VAQWNLLTEFYSPHQPQPLLQKLQNFHGQGSPAAPDPQPSHSIVCSIRSDQCDRRLITERLTECPPKFNARRAADYNGSARGARVVPLAISDGLSIIDFKEQRLPAESLTACRNLLGFFSRDWEQAKSIRLTLLLPTYLHLNGIARVSPFNFEIYSALFRIHQIGAYSDTEIDTPTSLLLCRNLPRCPLLLRRIIATARENKL
jgi:hypothetical protein